MSKPKVFLGFSEIANFISNYKKGFEALGHKTYTVVSSRNRYYPTAKYDVVMSELIEVSNLWPRKVQRILKSFKARIWVFLIFTKALFSCDIFYYVTGGHLLPFKMDLRLIKLFKKKLVVLYLGSEIRHWYAYQQEMRVLGYDELFDSCIQTYREQRYGTYLEKVSRISEAEKFANLILSQPGFAQLQKRPYMRINVGIFLPDYESHIPKRKVPLIVHAPSSKGIKGTEFIYDSLALLKSEGFQFEFKLIENMPNCELLVLLREADILVDELNSDTIGVLSTEGMATGNAVLTGYLPEFVKVPQPCPILNTNKSNVYENLKTLIIDVNLRVELAQKGLEYVRLHHDITQIASENLKMVCEVKEYDFVPTFFKSFSMPNEVLAEESAN